MTEQSMVYYDENNWYCSILNPAAIEAFLAALSANEFAGSVEIGTVSKWPPLSVGVAGGTPSMSPDLVNQAKHDISEIIPENN